MNIAILACGGIAHTMAQTLVSMPEVNKYAVASRSLEKAEKFAKLYGFEKAYGSYEELVKDPEVELVYVASPHSHHYEHVKLCLENGKHVLCEKAFCANAKQAKEILKMAEDKGLLLTEAIWPRYIPLTKTLQGVITSGVIGDITTVTANLSYSIDMNQRIYDMELAGGALLDVGVYALNFASMCIGNEIEDITAVCQKFDSGADKQNCVILRYKDGKMAVCNSGTQSVSDRKGIIYGRKGYIIVENINNPESFKVYNENREVIIEHVAPPQISGYEYEVYSAIDAIEKGLVECPECTHAQTITVMEWMDEARAQMGIKYPFE